MVTSRTTVRAPVNRLDSFGFVWIRKYYGWLTLDGIDQDPDKIAQIEPLDGDNVLQIKSASVNSNTFHLQDGVTYRVEGLVKRLKTDASFKITLLSSTYYLASNGELKARTPGAPPFFTQSTETVQLANGWEKFSLSFTGVNSNQYALRLQAGVDTVFIDELKIVDTEVNYWSINPHNSPRIVIRDGVRLGSGEEWDSSYQWHSLGDTFRVHRYIKDAENPAQQIELGDRLVGILAKDKEYIEIRDLVVSGCETTLSDISTEGAGILLSNGSSNNKINHVRVENSDAGIMVVSDAPNLINSDNVISGVEVAGTISQGIALRNHSKNNLITSSSVVDLGEFNSDYRFNSNGKHQDIEAISLGGATGDLIGNTVEYCHVSNIGLLEKGGSGIIAFNAATTTIQYNEVRNVGAAGIVIAAKSNDSKILYNIVTGVSKSPNSKRGPGIFISTISEPPLNNIEIYNNTVLDCANSNTWGALVLAGLRDNVLSLTNINVKNNIIEACKRKPDPDAGKIISGANIAYYAEYIDRTSLDSDYNVIYRDPALSGAFFFFRNDTSPTYEYWETLAAYRADNPSQEKKSASDNPLFVDVASENLHLTEDSPARNTGVAVGLKKDFDGNPIVGIPDIGAFEFQPDTDGDGTIDSLDNCPQDANPNQSDADSDGVGNVCDIEQLVVTSIASEDGWVRESTETSNLGGKSDAVGAGDHPIRFGDYKKDQQFKAIVSFDTSSLPAGSTVQAASLELTQGKFKGNNDPYATFGTAWVDLSANGFGGNPALSKSDFEAPADVIHTGQMTDDGTLGTASLDAAGQIAIEGSNLIQLRIAFELDDNDDAGKDYTGYYSGDNRDSGKHPRLVIDYTLSD